MKQNVYLWSKKIVSKYEYSKAPLRTFFKTILNIYFLPIFSNIKFIIKIRYFFNQHC